MKNGNGNFVIVITETAVIVEQMHGTKPWDIAKVILSSHNTSLVEIVPFPSREGLPSICGLIAEEGKLEGLYRNEIATRFCSKAFGVSHAEYQDGKTFGLEFCDYIAGPMVICINDENLSGLPFSQECLSIAIQTLGDFYHAKDAQPSTSESV